MHATVNHNGLAEMTGLNWKVTLSDDLPVVSTLENFKAKGPDFTCKNSGTTGKTKLGKGTSFRKPLLRR